MHSVIIIIIIVFFTRLEIVFRTVLPDLEYCIRHRCQTQLHKTLLPTNWPSFDGT